MLKRIIYMGILGILVIITLAPFIWMISTSLKHPADAFTATPQLIPIDNKTGNLYVTLENYVYVLNQAGFITAFKNSLIVVGVLVPLKLILNSLAAYAFARINFPGRDKFFMVLLSTTMLPVLALMIPRVYVTKGLGLYDSLWGLIIPMCMSVFDIFLLRQFFLGLPKDLDEAAKIDGASHLRILLQIILPLSRPVIALLIIQSFIWHWNDLVWPLVIISSPTKYTLSVALALLSSSKIFQPNYTMAGATLAVIPVVIILLIFQKHILQGVARTGLKG